MTRRELNARQLLLIGCGYGTMLGTQVEQQLAQICRGKLLTLPSTFTHSSDEAGATQPRKMMRQCRRRHSQLAGQRTRVGVAVTSKDGEYSPASWFCEGLAELGEVVQ